MSPHVIAGVLTAHKNYYVKLASRGEQRETREVDHKPALRGAPRLAGHPRGDV